MRARGDVSRIAVALALCTVAAIHAAAVDPGITYRQSPSNLLVTAAQMLGLLSQGGAAPDLYFTSDLHPRESGPVVVLAALGAFGGALAPFAAAALGGGVCFLAVLAAARGAGAGTALSIALGLMGALNPLVLSDAVVEGYLTPARVVLYPDDIANTLVLAAACVLLAILTREGDGAAAPLAAGLALGVAAGLSHPLVILIIPCLWRYGRGRARARSLALLAAGALATVLPWMLQYQRACGSVFIHPVQGCLLLCDPRSYSEEGICDPQRFGAAGDRLVFVHRFLGREFGFMGLLNWPFHDRVVRTPGFPVPVALFIPLLVLRSLGTLASALALAGLGNLWLGRRPRAVLLALWIAPTLLLLGANENWSIMKNRYAQPLVPALLVLAAHGAGWARRRGARALRLIVPLAIALTIGAWLVMGIRFPVDERFVLVSDGPWWSAYIEERERGMLETDRLLASPPLLPPNLWLVATHAARSPQVLERLAGLPSGPSALLSAVPDKDLPISAAIGATEPDAVILVPDSGDVVAARDGREAVSYRRHPIASDARYEVDLSMVLDFQCAGRAVYALDAGDLGRMAPSYPLEPVASGEGWSLGRLRDLRPCPPAK